MNLSNDPTSDVHEELHQLHLIFFQEPIVVPLKQEVTVDHASDVMDVIGACRDAYAQRV